MIFIAYVLSLFFALGVANASSFFNFFSPAIDHLPFDKAKVCECIKAIEMYHQELFDPTLMMLVKSLCPSNKTEVANEYKDFFFDIYKYWSKMNDFDRKDPKSWEALINDSFSIIAQDNQRLAENFIKTVVFPSREIIRRINYELDFNDFLRNSDRKIVKYLKNKIFEKFVGVFTEILSIPNVAESNLRFKRLFACADHEINMMTHLSAQNFQALSGVHIEQLKTIDLSKAVLEDVHDLVSYLLDNKSSEIKSSQPVKKSTLRIPTYSQSQEIVNLDLRYDLGDDSDQEQSFSFDAKINRRHMAVDQRMSKMRRPFLKLFYKIRYKSDGNAAFGKSTLLELLKGESGGLKVLHGVDSKNEPSYFTFDFGQERIINYIINFSSSEAQLLWDFIDSTYHKPHVYDHELIYNVARPPFPVTHGNLTKTFLNSLIYSALIRFNKIFPECAAIMNAKLGLNPELLDQVTAKHFINIGDNPHDILLRIVMWNHEETFDLFHKTFGPAQSAKVINRLFFKAYKAGNQYIIDYVFEAYKSRIREIAGSLLKTAVVYYDDRVIHYIVDNYFFLDAECLRIAGKYAIVFDDMELLKNAVEVMKAEEMITIIVPYAYSLGKYESVRFLLKSWIEMKPLNVSDAQLQQANYYSSKIGYIEGIESTQISGKEVMTLKDMAEINDIEIFTSNSHKINRNNREDAIEALKIAKSEKIVKFIFAMFPNLAYDSHTAALILINLIGAIEKPKFDSPKLTDYFISIISNSTGKLSEDALFEIVRAAILNKYLWIYKIFYPLKLKVSMEFYSKISTIGAGSNDYDLDKVRSNFFLAIRSYVIGNEGRI